MAIEVGDIVRYKWASGSDLGYFEVEKIGQGTPYSWDNTMKPCVFIKLIVHEGGEKPKSKNLKLRAVEITSVIKITPEYVRNTGAKAIAYQKKVLVDTESSWDNILHNIFPEEVDESKDPEEVEEEDFFHTLAVSGTDLLRKEK